MSSKDKFSAFNKPISREDHNKLKIIFDALESDQQAYDFLEPVDYVALGLDDYPSIVKHPMDVSTIKKNLKNIKYSTLQEIFNDIQLIWDNCKLYNMEGSDIYKMAIHCEKLVKKLIEKNFKVIAPVIKQKKSQVDSKNDDEDSASDEPNDNLTLQEKINLTERIRKLSNEGLSALVKLIQQECASALEELDSEKLQIKIDWLDRKTFEQINNLIENFLKIKETTNENLNRNKIKI